MTVQHYETRVECNLLWAFKHPDLADRFADGVFEEYGNTGTYRCDTSRDGHFSIIATRLPGEERVCMTEVVQAKRDARMLLDQATEMFFAEYAERQPAWMIDGYRAERQAKLEEMSA